MKIAVNLLGVSNDDADGNGADRGNSVLKLKHFLNSSSV